VPNADFDNLFGALLLVNGSISLDNLIDQQNVVAIQQGLDQLYGRIAAQNFNLNRRSPAPPNATQLNGTLTDISRLRLKQDLGTTSALEVLLAAMFLCAAASFWLVDTRKLLPGNPRNIAVQAALLADSELVKNELIPRGSEWSGDEGLRKRGVFEGFLFALGMWDTREDRGKIFGINVGDAEKVE
jgi:hypothetical protein